MFKINKLFFILSLLVILSCYFFGFLFWVMDWIIAKYMNTRKATVNYNFLLGSNSAFVPFNCIQSIIIKDPFRIENIVK